MCTKLKLVICCSKTEYGPLLDGVASDGPSVVVRSGSGNESMATRLHSPILFIE